MAARQPVTLTCERCGQSFEGDPRSKLCPDCKLVSKRECNRNFKKRDKDGQTRKIGSKQICSSCGKSFVLKSTRATLCPDCRALNEQTKRKIGSIHICSTCGKPFVLQNSRSYQCPECCEKAKQPASPRSSTKITRVCVICGKSFEIYPSDGARKCCSKKCGAELRTRNGHRGHFSWGLDARQRRAADPAVQAQIRAIQPASQEAVKKIPESQRGPQNRESLVWILIDPNGDYHMAVGLNDWARKNKNLFFPPDVDEDTAAMRIRSGFGAIASSMRGAASRSDHPSETYKGWRLARLPEPKKPGEETYDNFIAEEKENEK